jgi:signal transduction histidine kinase
MFDRFYRADPSRDSQIRRYGIGLSIARAVVSAHKGKITASSKDGKSLLITVVLP